MTGATGLNWRDAFMARSFPWTKHTRRAGPWCLLTLFMLSACSDTPQPLVREDASSDMPRRVDDADMRADLPDIPFVEGELPLAPMQDLSACGAPALGLDLNVCTASYLGGDGADTVTQVAIAPGGDIVFAGVFPGVAGYGPLNNEFGFGGDGAIVKVNQTGRLILGWSHIGGLVSALDVSPRDGMIVAGGGFGLMGLNAEMTEQVFAFPASAPEMLDVGFGGEVAWFAGQRLSVYSPQLDEVLASFDVEDVEVNDIVMDSWNQRAIITGFAQVSGNLQQPFVRAYDYRGEVVWSAWDWSASEAEGLGSDTRGMALAIGYDGALYFAGEAHGGETVFKRSPQDVSVKLSLAEQDDYARTFNLEGSAPIGFLARLSLGTGRVEAGTFLLTRLSSGKGNAARPRAIAANQDGTIALVGESACCIEDGAQKKVMGQAAMPGYEGGAFIAIFDGETLERKLWMTLHGGANAQMRDVDAWGRAVVVVQEHVVKDGAQSLEGQMILHESFFDTPQGGSSEVHLTVIPMP